MLFSHPTFSKSDFTGCSCKGKMVYRIDIGLSFAGDAVESVEDLLLHFFPIIILYGL